MHTHSDIRILKHELFDGLDSIFTQDVVSAFSEIQQARSDFQIDHFVVGQHDTEEMRYYQTLIELQNLYYTVRIVNLQVKKMQIEIEKLKSSGDELKHIDAQIREVELEQLTVSARGTVREILKLIDVYNSFQHKYTRQEIEMGQAEYWHKRLYRQAALEAVANGSTAQAAHLDSLRQIGVINFDEEGRIVQNQIENK